jgi:hypothetical protein
MKTLIDILRTETESLRVQFVEETKKWASNDFDNLVKWASEYSSGKYGYGEASKKYYRLPHCIINNKSITHNGGDPRKMFVDKAIENANRHYENSIEKLALRIEKKDLNTGELKTRTSHVGVNIETELTDGEKTVRAFTIIAGGQVQRPHYRYLIK